MDLLNRHYAIQRARELRKILKKHGVHPYAVTTCERATDGHSLSVTLDIVGGPAKVDLSVPYNMFEAYLVMIRCGLLAFLLEQDRQRIKDWQWPDPAQWQRERKVWRSGLRAFVNAAERDEERLAQRATRDDAGVDVLTPVLLAPELEAHFLENLRTFENMVDFSTSGRDDRDSYLHDFYMPLAAPVDRDDDFCTSSSSTNLVGRVLDNKDSVASSPVDEDGNVTAPAEQSQEQREKL